MKIFWTMTHNKHFAEMSWKSFILMHFRTLEFKIFFNHGELVLLKNSWKSFILIHFRTSKFKTFFNYGEQMLLKKSWKSFILIHFRTFKFNFFKLWWTYFCWKSLILYSHTFQNIKIQNFLQSCWTNFCWRSL